jgi:hypothetical protein
MHHYVQIGIGARLAKLELVTNSQNKITWHIIKYTFSILNVNSPLFETQFVNNLAFLKEGTISETYGPP